MIVAKVGLDGHDRGAKAVALALRDAGFEVIYTGLRQTPEAVVSAAVQEDVDVIGVSLLSGAHLEIMGRICDLLREQGAHQDVLVTVGGNIPRRDHERLREVGVEGIFSTDTHFSDVVEWIEEQVSERRGKTQESVAHGRN